LKSYRTKTFKKLFNDLPIDVQTLARKNYRLWKADFSHPGLQFKQVLDEPLTYSIRLGLHYRCLGIKKDEAMYWFWIGTHSAYDKIIQQLRKS
jgi:hypothetical protein